MKEQLKSNVCGNNMADSDTRVVKLNNDGQTPSENEVAYFNVNKEKNYNSQIIFFYFFKCFHLLFILSKQGLN